MKSFEKSVLTFPEYLKLYVHTSLCNTWWLQMRASEYELLTFHVIFIPDYSLEQYSHRIQP